VYSSSTCITHKYIAELLSVFSEYYYCIFGIFRLPSAILIHIHTSKYVKKLSNEKFLDIRELDENLITYYKEPKYIEWKSRHFLASLFANHLPFPFDIPWFITLIVLYMFSFFFCIRELLISIPIMREGNVVLSVLLTLSLYFV
jgi:hypothetical protein